MIKLKMMISRSAFVSTTAKWTQTDLAAVERAKANSLYESYDGKSKYISTGERTTEGEIKSMELSHQHPEMRLMMSL